MPIKELCTEQEWLQAFPLVKELRTHLDEQEFLALVKEMRPAGYRMFVLYHDDKMVAFTGIEIRTNLYYKRHVFVHELITDPNYRSQGFGETLLSFVHEWGKENNCEIVTLESALHRVDAHRFYESKMDYDKFCYSFKKHI